MLAIFYCICYCNLGNIFEFHIRCFVGLPHIICLPWLTIVVGFGSSLIPFDTTSELLPMPRDSQGGTTPMQAKRINLDLHVGFNTEFTVAATIDFSYMY